MDERRLPCSDSVRSESITAEHVPDREPDERNQRIFSSCSYSGGIAPTEQRTETHGDHRVAAFKTTTLSAAGYVHNLNTPQAYENFRRQRAQSRKRSPYPLGLDLVTTLDRYSEHGQAYVHEVRQIIRGNDLDKVDDATLIEMETIRLKPGD